MSIKKLNELIDSTLSTVDLAQYKFKLTASNEAKALSDKDFRAKLDRVVHVLYLNDSLLQNLAPESIKILTEGTDKTAIQVVLSRYRSLRSKRVSRLVSYSVGGEKTYKLVFDSFSSVRRFMDSLGLYGRPSAIFTRVTSDISLREKIALLVSKEGIDTSSIFSSASNLASALSGLNKSSSQESKELYRFLYDTTPGFDVGHNIPVAYEKVHVLASDKELLKELVTKAYSNLGLKSSYSKKLNTIIKETSSSIEVVKKQAFDLNFIASKELFDSKTHNNGVIQVLIEDTASNQGSESEIQLLNTFKTTLANSIRKALLNVDDKKIMNQQGSKSFIEDAEDRVVNTLIGKREVLGGKSTAKKVIKIELTSKVAKADKTSTTLNQKVSPLRLRNLRGQFTSLTSLDTLIRARLRETIKKNMVKPRLVNRTGRFADSVKLEGLANRDGEITAFLSYMKYPYATFEPGNRQGSESRSPTKLIDVSVREIAKTMVTNRLKTVIV